MSITLKCAACGAEVEFEELSSMVEETCPGCLAKVRYRECDKQMAIPVSMSLPEKFAHVDLSSVADKSSLLVGRYKKTTEEAENGDSVELVLAKALASLADSIGHLDERLTRHEQGEGSVRKEKEREPGREAETESAEEPSDQADASGGPQANGVKEVMGKSNGKCEEGEIVHLKAEEKEKFSGNGKANPVDARVLVRREAARAAHEFRLEKHTQGDWDERSGPADRAGFSWLMSHYPKTTVAGSMMLAGVLIMVTIFWMEGLIADGSANEELSLEAPEGPDLSSKLKEDDPQLYEAGYVVRGYLNATSAKAARPYVWRSEAIKDKFERCYQPISQPGSYELTPPQRILGKEGKPQFLYRVKLPGEQDRMLLVLHEGTAAKVFWEFFEEIGDVSWPEFFSERLGSPVEMRVWLSPVEQYVNGYDEENWQSYLLHDYAEKHRVLAYASRGLGDDWQLADALRNEPHRFHRHEAVMALLKLTYKTDFKIKEVPGAVAEINDVLATSWLPEDFRAEK